MIPLASLDLKDNTHLWEKGIRTAGAKVGLGVEAQGPAAGGVVGVQVAQHVLECVDGHLARGVRGRVGQPGLDAAVVVGGGLENDGLGGRVCVDNGGGGGGGSGCGG